MTNQVRDNLDTEYEEWLRLRWPEGEPSSPGDWNDVRTAFRAGYLTRHFKDGEIERAMASGIKVGIERERERIWQFAKPL